MASITNEGLMPPSPPASKPRLSPFEYRNTDLVSRLLAATPPYLYNMPLVPHSFFFSEMLRSLVQAKTENAARNAQQQAPQQRRSRKRSWTQVHPDYYSTNQQIKEPVKTEMAPPLPQNWPIKPERFNKPSEVPVKQNVMEQYHSFNPQMQPPTSSETVLPPPPPIWYPPLYPTPYGIDPLHFFIDLRVSGHIYDRKNQQKDPANSPHTITSPCESTDPFRYPRPHTSAFSVPTSRLSRNTPVNLTKEKTCTKFDVKSLGFERQSNKLGTNYILKNVFGIYKELQCCMYKNEPEESRAASATTTDTDNDKETEEEREKRVRDLRALIGLELVVDYMNHAKPGMRHMVEESSTDFDSSNSPAVDVVALHDESEGCVT